MVVQPKYHRGVTHMIGNFQVKMLSSSLEVSGFSPFYIEQGILGLRWRDRFDRVIMEFKITWNDQSQMYTMEEDGEIIFQGRTAQQVVETVWNRAVQLSQGLDI